MVSKIFETDAVKIVKLTRRPIGHHHPRSISLPHLDTSSTVSFIFGTLLGSPFLSECPALCDSACISSMVSNRHPFSFNFIFGNRVPNHGSMVGGGWQQFCFSPETARWGWKCEMGHCRGEAARSVLAKVWGNVFARFHAVAAERRSRTWNSQFGLSGQILCAQSPWHQRKLWSCSWHCFSPVWPLLALVTWGFSTGRIVALSQSHNRKPSSYH